MKSVEYTYTLTKEDRVRILFQKRRGKITHFIVQYYSLIGGEWRSIMRYDTCHGYAHCHTFHAQSEEYVRDLTKPGEDLNKIFTRAYEHIRRDFKNIKDNFSRN